MTEPIAGLAARSALPSDLHDVREIYRRASLSNENDREVLLRNPESLIWPEDGIVSGRTRVIVAGSRILGFATTALVESGVELEDLFVDPEFRRRGIATMLMDDLVDRLRQTGHDRIEVTANPHAAQFYASAGFVWVADTMTEFGPAPRLSLAI